MSVENCYICSKAIDHDEEEDVSCDRCRKPVCNDCCDLFDVDTTEGVDDLLLCKNCEETLE